MNTLLTPIAFIKNGFTEKFSIPRQGILASGMESMIIFEKQFRDENALRGIDGFSHIWLIWGFSENDNQSFHPTVRPPVLGGNVRVGVFATRSPFRPNGLGLSCVKLKRLEKIDGKGTVLIVEGADLMNNTPIYDIKPYLTYSDCIPDAVCGFREKAKSHILNVVISPEIISENEEKFLSELEEILKNDPRPAYQSDPNRVYRFRFYDREVSFTVDGNTLNVIAID